MNISRISPKVIVGVLIAIIFGISLLFRIVIPYEQAFNGEWIKFTSIDAYFYQRIIDVTANNFPQLMDFDPYLLYPQGWPLYDILFPYWFIAGVAWLLGAGSPTQHLVDAVSAYFPAILAALTVIPVYFIGRTLFNRWVGVIAAGLIAILPGEYLGRTVIGLNDTPAVETFLSTTFLAFAILAVKTARERGLTLEHLLKREWSKCGRPLVYSALAGLVLGLYLISWAGALLFVFIFCLFLVVQFINDHLRKQSTDYLGATGSVTLLVALLIFFSLAPNSFFLTGMILAFLVPVVLLAVSRLMTSWEIRPFYYPVALVVVGGIAMGAFYLISPDMLDSIFARFNIFIPSGASATTTVEMQPFLAPAGNFSASVAWGNFTTSFFLFAGFAFPGIALISLGILLYLHFRKNAADKSFLRPVVWVLAILAAVMAMLLLSGYGHRLLALLPLAILFVMLFFPGSERKDRLLFLIWTLAILFLTLGQRRFAYYLVVNIAVLSAYLSWQIIWLAGARKFEVKQEAVAPAVHQSKGKTRKKEVRRGQSVFPAHLLFAALAGVALFFLVFFPNLVKAKEMTTPEEAPYSPTDAWMSSLLWMRDNTPEPFGDPAAYYKIFPAPAPGEKFDYPDTAYGVTSWWDYGYWITHIAHRMPSANPSQFAPAVIRVADLFLSTDDDEARELLAEMDTGYVVIDYLTARSKYWAVATWAGEPLSKYFDIYYVPSEGQLQPVQFFYPAYYQSLVVRLYNFDGKAVTDIKAGVIAWVEEEYQGTKYRQVTDAREFSSYEEAVAYVESQESGNYAVVGANPFVSPVPLEAVTDFELIYSSEQGLSFQSVGFVPEVKIFEYTGQD